MKRRNLRHRYAKVLWISLLPLSAALAFEDVYEPNDTFEQATDIFVNGNVRQQYTLHRRDDEDWFKFSASLAGNPYQITAYNVGNNINVALELHDSDGTLLKDNKKCCNGMKKSFNWDVPADGIYYIKVSDIAKQSDDCRLNIQYELKIIPNNLGFGDIPVEILVTDAAALPNEKRILGAHVSVCGKKTLPEDEKNGEYALQPSCPNGTVELTVIAGGYKPLTCHLPIIGNVEEISQNVALIPIGQNLPIQPVSINPNDKLVPSQTLYHNGDQLQVEFPLFRLPENVCVRYYLALQYPEHDGRWFIIKRFNDLELFNLKTMPHWVGIGHENREGDAQVVIDRRVDNSLPRGEYKLYLLRMPGYVDEPINNLHLGELNVSSFRIE